MPTRSIKAQVAGSVGNTQNSGTISGFATGDLIVCAAGWYNGGGASGTMTISDTLGTLSWTKVGGTGGANRQDCALWYAIVGATTSGVVTLTNSNAGDVRIFLEVVTWSAQNGFGANGAGSVGDVNPPNDYSLTMTGSAPSSGDETYGLLIAREFSAMVIQAPAGFTETWDTTLAGSEISHIQTMYSVTATSLTVTWDLVSGDEYNEQGVAIVVKDGAVVVAQTPSLRQGYFTSMTGRR